MKSFTSIYLGIAGYGTTGTSVLFGGAKLPSTWVVQPMVPAAAKERPKALPQYLSSPIERSIMQKP